MQVVHVLLCSNLLTSQLVQAQVTERLDVLHRGVGVYQEGIVLLLPADTLLGPLFGGQMHRRLLWVEPAYLDSPFVQDHAFLLGILRRNAVAVMHHALLVGPAVGNALVVAVSRAR